MIIYFITCKKRLSSDDGACKECKSNVAGEENR